MLKVIELSIWNFRGIEHLEVPFTEQTSAFVGMNGVGKSTVLNALSIVLSQFTWRVTGQPNKARSISFDDIRIGAEFARISIKVSYFDKHIEWAISLNRSAHWKKYEDVNDLRSSYLDELKNFASELENELVFAEMEPVSRLTLPLVVSYGVSRSVLEFPMRARDRLDYRHSEAYEDSLDQGGADFKRFFSWFRNSEDIENERRLDSKRFRDSGLQAARRAIEVFTGFENVRIRRRGQLRMTVEKEGRELSVAQLSDGERNMLALVGDLTRRLAILNSGEFSPELATGIVLIDEIDLHLHPRWQRDVIRKLENTFPSCQFIVSTHSPQVIGELRPEAVLLLRDGHYIGHAPRSYGMSSSEILEEIMDGNGRNVDYSEKITLIENLIEDELFSEAKHELTSLRMAYGELPDVLRLDYKLEMSGDYDEDHIEIKGLNYPDFPDYQLEINPEYIQGIFDLGVPTKKKKD